MGISCHPRCSTANSRRWKSRSRTSTRSWSRSLRIRARSWRRSSSGLAKTQARLRRNSPPRDKHPSRPFVGRFRAFEPRYTVGELKNWFVHVEVIKVPTLRTVSAFTDTHEGGRHGEEANRRAHWRRRRPGPELGHKNRDLPQQRERYRGRRSPSRLGGADAREPRRPGQQESLRNRARS